MGMFPKQLTGLQFQPSAKPHSMSKSTSLENVKSDCSALSINYVIPSDNAAQSIEHDSINGYLNDLIVLYFKLYLSLKYSDNV